MSSSSGPRVSSARYTVTTEVHGEYAVLVLAGVIDMASAPHVADEVRAALRDRPPRLIFDLSAVTFLAPTGMSILMEAERRCRELSLDCRVVAKGPVTLRPMQQLGIDHMFQLYDSIDLAIGERCGPAET
ncbi:MAG: STAS domain-containing protein [Mycobacterium sp.]